MTIITTLNSAQAILLDALPGAAILVAESGQVLFANRKASNVLERSCDELTGAGVDAVLAPFDWLLNGARMLAREQRTRVLDLPSGRRITAGVSISATPTVGNGSGIGLALSRHIAEEAGGTLTIESVSGFGTSVTMDVPVHPIAPIPRQEPSPLAVSRSQ